MDSALEQIRKAATEALKILPALLGCHQELLLNIMRRGRPFGLKAKRQHRIAAVQILPDKAIPFTPSAYLHIKSTSKEAPGKEYTAGSFSKNDKGVYIIPLQEKALTFVLQEKN